MKIFKRAAAGLLVALFLATSVGSVLSVVFPTPARAIPSDSNELFRSQVDFGLDPTSDGKPRARGFRDRTLREDDKRDLVLNLEKTAAHPSTRTIVLTRQDGGADEYYIDICKLGRGTAASESGLIYDGKADQINFRKLENFVNDDDTRFIKALANLSVTELSSRAEIYDYVSNNYRNTAKLSQGACAAQNTNMVPAQFRKIDIEIKLNVDRNAYANLSQDDKVTSFLMAIKRTGNDNEPFGYARLEIPNDGEGTINYSVSDSDAINAFRTFEIGHYGASNSDFMQDLSGRFFGICQKNGSQTGDMYYYTGNNASDFDCNAPKIYAPFRIKFELNLEDLQKISAAEKARITAGTQDPANTDGVTTNTDTNFDESSGDLQCDTSSNPLTWLICPIVAAARETIDQLDNAIVSELNINEDDYFNEDSTESNTGKNFYTVWTNFRNIGLVLLILTALVMVVSQALSIGPFDAYSVKKILPRILVAVIFMTLSWDISKFLIALTNDIGFAVRAIIQAPFAEVDNPMLTGGSSVAGAILVGAAGIGLGIIGLLSFALTGILAVLIAFVVLTIRKMLIIFMVLLAPFAIACYILPNTQKVYKLWWETFSKGLLMFPIIMGFIAVGRVFARVAGEGGGGLLDQLVMVIAYFGPYFALPAAFRLAGGAIATISGVANDRSRGVFDRLKKGRQERMKHNFERAGNSERWNPQNKFVKWSKANKLASIATSPVDNAAYATRNLNIPGLSHKGKVLASQLDRKALESTAKVSELLKTADVNDRGLKAINGGNKYLNGLDGGNGSKRWGNGLNTLHDFEEAADLLAASDDENDVLAATQLRSVAGEMANLYHTGEVPYANLQGAALMEQARQGFAGPGAINDVVNRIKADPAQAGFAERLRVSATLAGGQQRPDAKVGYGSIIGDNGDYINTHDVFDAEASRDWSEKTKQQALRRVTALGSGLKPHEIMYAKDKVIEDGAGMFEYIASASHKLETGDYEPWEEEALRDAATKSDSMINNIVAATSPISGNSPAAKAEWEKVMGRLRTSGAMSQEQYDKAMGQSSNTTAAAAASMQEELQRRQQEQAQQQLPPG